MVHVVESWDDLENYAEWCRYGIYQETETVNGGKEVRVIVGKFGYIGKFDDEKDETYQRIIRFCKAKGLIRIRETIPEDLFFAKMEV